MPVKSWIKRRLERFDVAITRHSRLRELEHDRGAAEILRFLLEMPRSSLAPLAEYWSQSKSQNRQDLFVLAELAFKTNGYFIDFGATDGVTGSNSVLLEREFGWRGIAAEPARCWHEQLRVNRRCIIDTSCVWKETGASLTFNEVTQHPSLSTIGSFTDSDSYSQARHAGMTYEVKTVSLLDLLAMHDAPRDIDYLSIDTEGSELDILSSFDFSKYRIRVITCEHNYTPARQAIYDLLRGQGYVRKYETLSKYDDWYVLTQ
jgi:FkbM family methyltransferase